MLVNRVCPLDAPKDRLETADETHCISDCDVLNPPQMAVNGVQKEEEKKHTLHGSVAFKQTTPIAVPRNTCDRKSRSTLYFG